jgi:(2R)-sulfolactate sulfo-lyase subunit alpha
MASNTPPQFLLHQDGDNVAVAVQDLEPGTVTGASVKNGTSHTAELKDTVPLGHKFALVAFSAGDPILKYGIKVGVATQDIAVGQYIHVHNMRSARWEASRA